MLQGPFDLDSFNVYLRLWNEVPWVKFTPPVASLNALTSVDLHQRRNVFCLNQQEGPLVT